ncbi:hypothetical protein V6N13_126642 [Hibiscus sabdariffa]|uniref:C2 domain-containing protein n=2 Tax=Hibiscus sabdariffa TaxID=183260 RepID=A0ABR1ZK17_9ROSI
MDWTSLELKLISCTNLKSFNFFRQLSVYSVVSMVIINDNDKSKKKHHHQKKHLQRQKTSIQRGGRNPEWNHLFQFDLQNLPPEETHHLFVNFDVRLDGLVDRTIGQVRLPLKVLIDEFSGVVRLLTYQVRDSDGKPNGVLKFSYKLKGKINTSANHDSLSPRLIGKSHCSSEKAAYRKHKPESSSRAIQPCATYWYTVQSNSTLRWN